MDSLSAFVGRDGYATTGNGLGYSPGLKHAFGAYTEAMLDAGFLLRHYLLFFILPLWIVAGFMDYLLHKRTHIEDTAGAKESLLHVLQLCEAGVPVLLGLLLEINALIIFVMLVALILHEITALWDVSYAYGRRYISPLEQHVHGFMEILPLMAVSFVTVMYWEQFIALFGLGSEAVRFELRPKTDPLSSGYLAALFCSIALFIVLPYGEELRRCLRTSASRRLRDNVKHTMRPSQAA
jgi:hypothetical protein